jgi:hypothetical protein
MNGAVPGGTIKYIASVTKTSKEDGVRPATDQAVQWKILGSHGSGTMIDNMDYTSGEITLTIETTKPAGEIIILQATSREGTVVATVDVTVQASILNTEPGGYFTDQSDVEWLVVVEEGDHKLIMTRHVYGLGTQYNIENEYTELDSGDNNLKTVLKTFYKNQVGSDTKSVTVPYISPLPDIYNDTNSAWQTTGEGGKSHPDASGKVDETGYGSNAVFVLSITEAMTYPTLDTEEKRKAPNVDNELSTIDWRLRSPGGSSSAPATIINGSGILATVNAISTNRGYRPALWVKS